MSRVLDALVLIAAGVLAFFCFQGFVVVMAKPSMEATYRLMLIVVLFLTVHRFQVWRETRRERRKEKWQ